MSDYASNGLTSSADFGASCMFLFGYPCAFAGVNPNAPPLPFLNSIGRSVYNGLQTKLTGNVPRPFVGVHNLNFQISYALSRFENSGGTFGSGASSPYASDQDPAPTHSTMLIPAATSVPRFSIALTRSHSVDMPTYPLDSNSGSSAISGARSQPP
jgi:hypothetical protein